jgi:RNA polymerase sigma-70 factor, ECF subfamily
LAPFRQCKVTAGMRPSDEELYRRMQRGDRTALAELYERLGARIYRYALYASGRQPVAEEVTQEAFLRLIGAGERFDEQRGSLEAYLYGLARNLLRGLSRTMDFASDEDPLASGDLLGELIDDERTTALYEALAELPPGYRDAVVLCDLEERSYEEAARLMQCPTGTVRSRLHRARLLLSAKLTPLKAPAFQASAR